MKESGVLESMAQSTSEAHSIYSLSFVVCPLRRMHHISLLHNLPLLILSECPVKLNNNMSIEVVFVLTSAMSKESRFCDLPICQCYRLRDTLRNCPKGDNYASL
jgi:hypothetical protein